MNTAKNIETAVNLLSAIMERTERPDLSVEQFLDLTVGGAALLDELAKFPADFQDAIKAFAVLTEVQEAIGSGISAVLDWHYVANGQFPDDDTRVFVALRGSEHLHEAYLESDSGAHVWFLDSTQEPLAGVYAWTHIPSVAPDLEAIAEEEGVKP